MSSLFMIAQEYRSAADQLADLDLPDDVVRDTLEGMAGELEVKAEAVACFAKGLQAMARAIKERESELKARRESMERRAESLLRYLGETMTACGIEKIERPGAVIGWRKSSAVVIDDPALVPATFMRTPEPPPPQPDKEKIAASIKGGCEVPGARIETRRNLSIK